MCLLDTDVTPWIEVVTVTSAPSPPAQVTNVHLVIKLGSEVVPALSKPPNAFTGMGPLNVLDWAVRSSILQSSPSRVVISDGPVTSTNTAVITQTPSWSGGNRIHYKIAASSAKLAGEVAAAMNSEHFTGLVVENNLETALWATNSESRTVCSMAVVCEKYVCCSWIAGTWTESVGQTELTIIQDWTTCRASFTPNGEKVLQVNQNKIAWGDTKHGVFSMKEEGGITTETITWKDEYPPTPEPTLAPVPGIAAGTAASSPAAPETWTWTRTAPVEDIGVAKTLLNSRSSLSSTDAKPKWIESVTITNLEEVQAACGCDAKPEPIDQSLIEKDIPPIEAYNVGTALDVHTASNGEILIFVGGVNNVINTGFDFDSIFRPATFVAKFTVDPTAGTMLIFHHMARDVDRRYPRFVERRGATAEDARSWGDVRDLKIGDGCSSIIRVIDGERVLESIPCLYAVGYSPSLKATYINKLNILNLENIPVQIVNCLHSVFLGLVTTPLDLYALNSQ